MRLIFLVFLLEAGAFVMKFFSATRDIKAFFLETSSEEKYCRTEI